MKNIIISKTLIALLLLLACNTRTDEHNSQNKDEFLNPFPINLHSDTLNYKGLNGKKHGVWLVNGKKIIYKNDTAYPITDSTKVDELVRKLNAK